MSKRAAFLDGREGGPDYDLPAFAPPIRGAGIFAVFENDAHLPGGCFKAGQKVFASIVVGMKSKLRKLFPVCVGHVKNMGHAEAVKLHRGLLLACAFVLDGAFTYTRGEDRNTFCALLNVPSQCLPCVETGDARSGRALQENEQGIIERVGMKAGYGTQPSLERFALRGLVGHGSKSLDAGSDRINEGF